MPAAGAATTRLGQDRVLRAQLLGQAVALGRRLRQLAQHLGAPLGLEALEPARGLRQRGLGGVQGRLGLGELAQIVAVLALDLDHLQLRIEAAVGQLAHRLALPLEQLQAVAQPLDLGGGRAHLAAPGLHRLGQRLAAAGLRGVARLQQRLLGGQEIGP